VRLLIGGQGQVNVGGANRVRSAPTVTAEKIGEIPVGEIFDVISGPECAEGYQWWLVEYNGLRGWTAESHGSTYYVTPIEREAVASPAPTATSVFADQRPSDAITPLNADVVGEQARFGDGSIMDLAWSPDGRTIAVGTSIGVRLYDANDFTSPPRDLLPDDVFVNDIEFSPDGQLIAAANTDHHVRVWSVETGEQVHDFQSAHPVTLVVFSPDGYLLAAHSSKSSVDAGIINVWALDQSRHIRSWEMTDSAERLMFSTDSRSLVASDFRGLVIWDVASGEYVYSFSDGDSLQDWSIDFDDSRLIAITKALGDGPTDQGLYRIDLDDSSEDIADVDFYSAQFLKSADLLLTWSHFSDLQIRDANTLTILETLTSEVNVISNSADESLIAVGSRDGGVRVFTTPVLQADGTVSYDRKPAGFGIVGPVTHLAFSPDKIRIAASGADNTIRVWDVETGERLVTFAGYTSSQTGVAFCPDGLAVRATEPLGEQSGWNVLTNQPQASLPLICQYASSHDGSWVVSYYDNGVHLLNAVTGEQVAEAVLSSIALHSFAFDQSGALLVAGNTPGSYPKGMVQRVTWDASGATVETLTAYDAHGDMQISQVAFGAADNRLLMAVYYNGIERIRIFDAADLRLLSEIIPINMPRLVRFALSPDGRFLAALFEDSSYGNAFTQIGIWNVDTGSEVARLHEGNRRIPSFALSPDGSIIASGDKDGLIELWDVQSQRVISTLRGHTAPVTSLDFGPRGALLASASEDGTVRLWGID